MPSRPPLPSDPALLVAARLRSGGRGAFSALIARIAVGSIAVGLAVVIVSFAIFKGFTGAIQEKIFSLAGHVQVESYARSGNRFGSLPIRADLPLYADPAQFSGVAHVQPFAKSVAMLYSREDKEVFGALFKGVGPDFDRERFAANLAEGAFPEFPDSLRYSKEIVVSRYIADKLRLSVGAEVLGYFNFTEDPTAVRPRKLTVAGVYETGLEDFDRRFVFGDLRLLQRFGPWRGEGGTPLVSGYEIFVEDFGRLEAVRDDLHARIDPDLRASAVTERFAHFFDWFAMLRQNVYILLVVILAVASFNVVSIVFILIMERTSMIGTLKALGATDWQIQKVFVYRGLRMIGLGLAFGNAVGLGFCLAQSAFRLVPLDPANYYVDYVPVQIEWGFVLLANALTVALVGLILFLPTLIVSRIAPAQSIRFA